MSEGQNKSRVISFRMSEDEYRAIEIVSWRHGFTSVSLFAREATLTSQSSEPARFGLDVELNRLWRRIEAITSTIEKLTAYAGMVLAPLPQEGEAEEQEHCFESLARSLDTVAKALGLVLATRHKLLTMQPVLMRSEE